MADMGRSKKTCTESVPLVNQCLQIVDRPLPELVSRQIKGQRQHMRRLCSCLQTAILIIELFTEGLFYPFGQSTVFFSVFLFSKNNGCPPHQFHGVCIIGRGSQIIRRFTEPASRSGIERQPVSILISGIPDHSVFCPVFYITHPALHHRIGFLQKPSVPGILIYCVRTHDSRIPPSTGRMIGIRISHIPVLVCQNIGNNVWNPAIRKLCRLQIPQPFPKERRRLHEVRGCSREYLDIPCPAHPFVPLRAVCGNIHKIALHAPAYIFFQPVY